LCFVNGDCFVYLREPGQSSRGPSFRVHVSQLRVKGFGALVDRCTQQVQFTHENPKCLTNGCKGCGKPSTMRALYLPAPRGVDLETTIDHHLGVRNFFAWLYNVPMAGRTLGKSLSDLKDHLDLYRPNKEPQNQADVVTFADFQRYLDFRECADHALAAIQFAEKYQIEDLWIDAFAHCVGMDNKSLRMSLEYPGISRTSKLMISKTRLEVEFRTDRVSRSVANFFENDLSATFLVLHTEAREHLDRFRSFLQSFYIEQHGFWPPQDFGDEEFKKRLYGEMYSDFRNLYHHLVDPESTSSMINNVSHSGGIRTLQNIQAFDARHSYETLPHPLPMLPTPPSLTTSKSIPKLGNMNLGKKCRELQEARDEQSIQALIDSSNRDWSIMACPLVRRYSEFERLSVLGDFENVSLVDGRKVRWILIYAVLQTLIAFMQAPKQVPNTERLSYSLCCHIPKTIPWAMVSTSSFNTQSLPSSRTSEATAPAVLTRETKMELTPDVSYSHTNSLGASLSHTPLHSRPDRRNSLPLPPTSTTRTTFVVSRKCSAASPSSSLRHFLVKRAISTDESPLPAIPRSTSTTTNKPPLICEIFMQRYGNGLNDAIVSKSPTTITPKAGSATSSPIEAESPVDNVLVSRESSSASASSAYTARSGSTNPKSGDEEFPDMDHLSVSGEDSHRLSAGEKGKKRQSVHGFVRRARLSL
jgi:hypothetical protein